MDGETEEPYIISICVQRACACSNGNLGICVEMSLKPYSHTTNGFGWIVWRMNGDYAWQRQQLSLHKSVFAQEIHSTHPNFLILISRHSFRSGRYIRFGSVQIYKQLLNWFNSISSLNSDGRRELERENGCECETGQDANGRVCVEIAQIIFGMPVSIVHIAIYMCARVFAQHSRTKWENSIHVIQLYPRDDHPKFVRHQHFFRIFQWFQSCSICLMPL